LKLALEKLIPRSIDIWAWGPFERRRFEKGTIEPQNLVVVLDSFEGRGYEIT
jgi:hypothetical protein